MNAPAASAPVIPTLNATAFALGPENKGSFCPLIAFLMFFEKAGRKPARFLYGYTDKIPLTYLPISDNIICRKYVRGGTLL